MAVVEDALMQLAGYPLHQQTLSDFIRRFIPAGKREAYLKITSTIEDSNGLLAHSTACNVHYEGSRVQSLGCRPGMSTTTSSRSFFQPRSATFHVCYTIGHGIVRLGHT